MKLRLLSALLLISSFALSQELDRVYLKNKEVVSGKILQVTSENIEIDPEGSKPFLIIKRKDAKVIIYSDNTVVYLDIPKMEQEKNNSRTENIRIDGFRTDGYYINKYPLLFKSNKQINIGFPIGKITTKSAKYHLYIAFKILAEREKENDDYREIQVGFFMDKKSEWDKLTKNDKNMDRKEFFEKYFTKDAITRQFLENDLRKIKDELVLVQFKWDDMLTLINDPKGLTLFIHNFTGLEQDIPSADFKIGKSSTDWKHPSEGVYYEEDKFTKSAYKKMFDPFDYESNKFWTVYLNTRLIFIPDSEN